MHRGWLALTLKRASPLVAVLLLASACATPIGVTRVELLWSGYRVNRFVSLGEFKVRGFLNRYRQAGVGAPLAAELAPAGEGADAELARKRILPRLKMPVTAVLRIEDVSDGIASGNLKGRIEIHAADAATTVETGGRHVPLYRELVVAVNRLAAGELRASRA